jgi:hypothetical protein
MAKRDVHGICSAQKEQVNEDLLASSEREQITYKR